MFRVGTSKNTAWIVTKTFLQASALTYIFLYKIPVFIQYLESINNWQLFDSLPYVGWPLIILFAGCGVYGGFSMSLLGKGTPLPLDCAPKLVIGGAYQFVRNPMAIAGIGQIISAGLVLGSWGVILYGLQAALVWHFLVRPSEERDLQNRFGEDFVRYKKRVGLWVPRFRTSD